MKRSVDFAGRDTTRLNLVLAERVPEVEKLIGEIEHVVKRYVNSVEMIKRVRDHFKSMKEYWEHSKSDTLTFAERIERQIDNLERQIKDIESEIESSTPTPEKLLPLVTRLEALRGMLTKPEEGLKTELMNEQLKLTKYDTAIIYAEIMDRRLNSMLERFESEGQKYFVELEESDDIRILIDYAMKIRNADEKALEEMRDLAKVLGPKVAEASAEVTRERVKRIIEEHIAKMKSSWTEEEWEKERIEEESEKLEKELWKQWEPYL